MRSIDFTRTMVPGVGERKEKEKEKNNNTCEKLPPAPEIVSADRRADKPAESPAALPAVVFLCPDDRQWCPNAGLVMTPRRRVGPPRKSPRSPSVSGLGAEHGRRHAGLQQRPGQPQASIGLNRCFLSCADEPDGYLTVQLPCCHSVRHWHVPGGHPGMARCAGTSLGSSSARGSTGGDGPGVPRSHQAHGSSERVCVGRQPTRFRRDHLSALQNPRRHVGD